MLGTPSADILVALSEFSYQQLSRKYPHKQCIRSRHGIILSASHIDVAAVAARRNKQLFFGRIFPYKGITTLLNAFAIAQRIDPAIELTIVGRGRLGTRLLRQIAGLDVHLDNRYVPDNEIKGILASHGVIVLPYSSATQSGVAALALGNGIPCIATNVGALPEQIIHGRNGLLVPPRDPESLARAMVAVSGNADLARQMAIEARSVGKENYSWNDIGQLLLEDLARCLYHSANGR
jgi:glycosyltransferase involved in cell wall biosynthesis